MRPTRLVRECIATILTRPNRIGLRSERVTPHSHPPVPTAEIETDEPSTDAYRRPALLPSQLLHRRTASALGAAPAYSDSGHSATQSRSRRAHRRHEDASRPGSADQGVPRGERRRVETVELVVFSRPRLRRREMEVPQVVRLSRRVCDHRGLGLHHPRVRRRGRTSPGALRCGVVTAGGYWLHGRLCDCSMNRSGSKTTVHRRAEIGPASGPAEPLDHHQSIADQLRLLGLPDRASPRGQCHRRRGRARQASTWSRQSALAGEGNGL